MLMLFIANEALHSGHAAAAAGHLGAVPTLLRGALAWLSAPNDDTPAAPEAGTTPRPLDAMVPGLLLVWLRPQQRSITCMRARRTSATPAARCKEEHLRSLCGSSRWHLHTA